MTGEQLLVVQKLWLVVEDDVQRGAVVPAKYLARVGSKHVQVDVIAGEGSWCATAFVCDGRVSGRLRLLAANSVKQGRRVSFGGRRGQLGWNPDRV